MRQCSCSPHGTIVPDVRQLQHKTRWSAIEYGYARLYARMIQSNDIGYDEAVLSAASKVSRTHGAIRAKLRRLVQGEYGRL